MMMMMTSFFECVSPLLKNLMWVVLGHWKDMDITYLKALGIIETACMYFSCI